MIFCKNLKAQSEWSSKRGGQRAPTLEQLWRSKSSKGEIKGNGSGQVILEGILKGSQKQKHRENRVSFSTSQVAHSGPFPCSHSHNVAIFTAACFTAKGDSASKEQRITAEFNSILINHWQNKIHLITYWKLCLEGGFNGHMPFSKPHPWSSGRDDKLKF